MHTSWSRFVVPRLGMYNDWIGFYPTWTWYIIGAYFRLGFCIIIAFCNHRFNLCYVGGKLRIIHPCRSLLSVMKVLIYWYHYFVMCRRVMFSIIIPTVAHSRFPKFVKVLLFAYIYKPIKCMSIALESFCCIFLFTMP